MNMSQMSYTFFISSLLRREKMLRIFLFVFVIVNNSFITRIRDIIVTERDRTSKISMYENLLL